MKNCVTGLDPSLLFGDDFYRQFFFTFTRNVIIIFETWNISIFIKRENCDKNRGKNAERKFFDKIGEIWLKIIT